MHVAGRDRPAGGRVVGVAARVREVQARHCVVPLALEEVLRSDERRLGRRSVLIGAVAELVGLTVQEGPGGRGGMPGQ